MRKITTILILFIFQITFSQENRIEQIKNNLETLKLDSPGLSEKVNINIKEASLSSFLIAIAENHKLNISVAPSLAQINLVNDFTNVTVSDLLIFLCKEYSLSIDFSGNILSVKSIEKPVEKPIQKEIDVKYDITNDWLSLDLKEDKLYDVFKKIMDVSGKNLVFAPGLENNLLTAYIKNVPFDVALNKLAYANNLNVAKSRDNFYIFDQLNGNFSPTTIADNAGIAKQSKPQSSRKSNFFFTVVDAEKKLLDVDFENIPISSIVYDIGHELDIDMFVSSPLDAAGNATVKAKNITFDALLVKIFENKTDGKSVVNSQQSQPQSQYNNETSFAAAGGDSYTFKKSGQIYYFGTKNQLVVRNIKSIALMHRSIELLSDPAKEGKSAGRMNNNNNNNNYNTGTPFTDNRSNSNLQSQNYNAPSETSNASTSILSIIPDEIKKDLDIKIDKELNSFLVNGPEANINRFESFLKNIDKAVPVILIEVMLVEVNTSVLVETGIEAGIGDKPVTTKGTVFPAVDIALGAETINKIISNLGFSNVGSVSPNFYLTLQALEKNGNIKIRSSPKLSTLNGHKAFLSIGETTYYVVTNQNYYGSQIPQTSEVKNYQPIDADLSVTIMPLVSGNGDITMDIKVIQSRFNGVKIDKNAPPGMFSREFTSIIRVKDKDLIVLGGLEESVKSDSSSGVPILSRIPILNWFFSSKSHEASNKKLTVLIKPTVLY
jgi:type IV pilus assembly protein PilQ